MFLSRNGNQLVLVLATIAVCFESSKSSNKSVHVALISGCDSHVDAVRPLANSLLHHASKKGKYRVTFVIGSQCRSIADDIGADFFDTGAWYYNNLPPKNRPYFEMHRNLSIGPIIYGIPAMELLVSQDKPDIVLSEMYNTFVSVITELHNIPLATVWISSMPHPAMLESGSDFESGVFGVNLSSKPGDPRWLRIFYQQIIFVYWAISSRFLKYDSILAFNQELKRRGFEKQYQDFYHVVNTFPSVALAGPPLFPYSEVPGKFFIAGMQPMTSPKESVMNVDLKDFIKQSDRDIIYISMGTHAYLEDAQFQVMKDALMKQTHFNVIWSHSDWNEQKYGDKIDSKRLFVRKKQPQKEILKQPKVKVFLSHCGASSLNEGVYNLKVFIGCPQIRDQFIASKAITNNNLGNVISSSPTEQEILASIEDIWNNYPVYSENVKNLQKNLTSGSVERLERIIDYLVEQEKPIQFDVNETNVMPLWKAWLILGVCFLPFLTVFALVLTGLIWCIKKLRGQNKEKRNSKHRSAKSKKIN